MDSSGGAGPPKKRLQHWPNRQDHSHEWWGQPHPNPKLGHPDRLHMFVRPSAMSREEQESILARWNESVSREPDVSAQGLSHHLRPSSPRGERVKKKIQKLQDMGEEISIKTREIITEHEHFNYGLIESLHHYCQGETHVPVCYANELIRMNERLMLESATQMDAASRTFREAIERGPKGKTGRPRYGRRGLEVELGRTVEQLQFQLNIAEAKYRKAVRESGPLKALRINQPLKHLHKLIRDFWSRLISRKPEEETQATNSKDVA